jgi:hypothetical protein
MLHKKHMRCNVHRNLSDCVVVRACYITIRVLKQSRGKNQRNDARREMMMIEEKTDAHTLLMLALLDVCVVPLPSFITASRANAGIFFFFSDD